MNLIAEMRDRYKVAVGLSDHTLTNYASFAAVSAGATLIERHFTLSKDLYGSDAKHSLEPAEFTDLCKGVRAIETILANPVDKADVRRFAEMKRIFEKSVVSLRDISAGEKFTAENIALKKPGGGIAPARYAELLMSTAKRKIAKDTALHDADVS